MGRTVLPQFSLYGLLVLLLAFVVFILIQELEIEGESFFPIQVRYRSYYFYYGGTYYYFCCRWI